MCDHLREGGEKASGPIPDLACGKTRRPPYTSAAATLQCVASTDAQESSDCAESGEPWSRRTPHMKAPRALNAGVAFDAVPQMIGVVRGA